jgi:tripartite-type tricarboxylate transporter receptor subunit TctC
MPDFGHRQPAWTSTGAAGSGTDIVGRGLAEAVRKHMPVRGVVMNQPGGAGTIAMAEVVLAKPDGYTGSLVATLGLAR